MRAARPVPIVLCFLCAVASPAKPPDVGTPVTRVALADFEGGGSWRAYERGYAEGDSLEAAVSLRPGAPAALAAAEAARGPAEPIPPQRQVLGVRLGFHRLADTLVAVEPERPIPIAGGSLWVLSAWVASEGRTHDLYAALLDSDGRPYAEVLMGRLDYRGWKLLRVTPDLLQPPGGMLWNGFVLRIDPRSITLDAQYFYFDFVTATLFPDAAEGAP